MTGPIARVTCPKCGRLLARKRDGTPFVHGCDLVVTPRLRLRNPAGRFIKPEAKRDPHA